MHGGDALDAPGSPIWSIDTFGSWVAMSGGEDRGEDQEREDHQPDDRRALAEDVARACRATGSTARARGRASTTGRGVAPVGDGRLGAAVLERVIGARIRGSR